jgi:L-arabinose isomerase
MIDFETVELWFVTGSQHLYGDQTLKTVAAHAGEIAGELARSANVPIRIVAKPILTTPDAITQLCTEANASPRCVGIISWMHTLFPGEDVAARPAPPLQAPFCTFIRNSIGTCRGTRSISTS